MQFLLAEGGRIRKETEEEVVLRGVNLGGWLMMEGYILGGRNIPEKEFKRDFARRLGREELRRFERDFYSNFIRKEDIRRLKSMGVNCLRLPFNFRLLKKYGFYYLDRLIAWCKEFRLYLILDLHSAPGGQNADWHSDTQGESLLWRREEYQKQTLSLWHSLAKHYSNEPIIAGYDLLNEPVARDIYSLRQLKRLYQRLIETIREVDKRHIIFLEGNLWAQEIDFLQELEKSNIVWSIHFYQPLDFTFNFRPHLLYPGEIDGEYWDKKRIRDYLTLYYRKAKECKVPIYVGEFGVNYRWGCRGELRYLKESIEVFEEFGFHWTYWTYKAVANKVYPDGLYQYTENPEWVRREGVDQGWESFASLWKRNRKKIISSWRTESFREEEQLIEILQRFLR
ncbi:MAG: hypothetical protein DRP75_00860 [Candidatus Omnitrophota bacterium]|nr:MAG: hypothetical protein DRP75_00860 [Candidatus Omnitrophota bacterium]